jgi:triosephosphate isomerase
MARTPFICGNWKLNHSLESTRATLREMVEGASGIDGVEMGIAPVMTTLAGASEITKGSRIHLAAQNAHFADKGAYTGECSIAHLAEVGCSHVIVGHSERRQYFGETDETVGQKVRAVFDGGLIPIACCGESLEQRDAGRTMEVVRSQVIAILEGCKPGEVDKLVIAYEPIWAIGTGRTATAAQAQEVHAGIRALVRDRIGAAQADALRIQYGGSVKPGNAAELLAEVDVDGALVGGASLKAEDFLAICKAAQA